eukprot:jgi/Ulvmu1/5861/UM025_0123.1
MRNLRTGRLPAAARPVHLSPCHARTVAVQAQRDVFFRPKGDVTLDDMSAVQLKSRERPVIQWYPGHIARAERQLKEQLSKVDIVFEVRDARILTSTRHPQLDEWTNNKTRILIVNRIDQVSKQDVKIWKEHFAAEGRKAFFTNGKLGFGTDKVQRAAASMSQKVNASRVRRGLKPRPVRACVMGFPNIGKSAIINRLLNRRVAQSAAKPGVTRALRWIRMGEDLDLLDAPGIIPMSMGDQSAAEALAMCNDIGSSAYIESAVGAAFVALLPRLPNAAAVLSAVEARYGISPTAGSPEDFVWALAEDLFQGDPERAGQRLLKDYRDLRLGAFALEHPPP